VIKKKYNPAGSLRVGWGYIMFTDRMLEKNVKKIESLKYMNNFLCETWRLCLKVETQENFHGN